MNMVQDERRALVVALVTTDESLFSGFLDVAGSDRHRATGSDLFRAKQKPRALGPRLLEQITLLLC